VAIGDLNGDGHLDLATANGNVNSVSVLLGDGSGGFGPHADFATVGHTSSVAIGDLNGDGHPDLAAANWYTARAPDTVSVLLGDGIGGFGPHTDFPTDGHPQSVAIGDLNGDGHLDLVTANGSSYVSVLLGHGSGGFGPHTDFAHAGFDSRSVAIGDLNGDGRPDLVTANGVWNSVSVLFNAPAVPRVPGIPTIGTVAAGDGQATVSWAAPVSDGGSPITGYVVTPYIGDAPQSPVPFNSTATTETVTGLTNGTTYQFRVQAINAVGTGPYSALSEALTPGTPGPPTIGTATAASGQATVSWTAPSYDGGSPITGYTVTPYVSTWTGLPRTFNSTATTQTITGLTNGWPYRFRVQAINNMGTGTYSAETNRVTPTA
jgi:hypothetical protein